MTDHEVYYAAIERVRRILGELARLESFIATHAELERRLAAENQQPLGHLPQPPSRTTGAPAPGEETQLPIE